MLNFEVQRTIKRSGADGIPVPSQESDVDSIKVHVDNKESICRWAMERGEEECIEANSW